jgi:hypothetical protein
LFETFWREYPKREGPNPKAPARKKFLALVASGEDADRIIEGARRCREDHGSRNEIRTRYIAQAVTWLNQRRWEDYLAMDRAVEAGNGPPVPPDPSMPSDDELRRRYARHGNTSGIRAEGARALAKARPNGSLDDQA